MRVILRLPLSKVFPYMEVGFSNLPWPVLECLQPVVVLLPYLGLSIDSKVLLIEVSI